MPLYTSTLLNESLHCIWLTRSNHATSCNFTVYPSTLCHPSLFTLAVAYPAVHLAAASARYLAAAVPHPAVVYHAVRLAAALRCCRCTSLPLYPAVAFPAVCLAAAASRCYKSCCIYCCCISCCCCILLLYIPLVVYPAVHLSAAVSRRYIFRECCCCILLMPSAMYYCKTLLSNRLPC